jgi:putative ABC transport system permease protein
MEWLKSFELRIKTLVRRRQLEADLDDELAFHKTMRESQPTAERARRFGNVTRLKEQCREQWTFPFIESIVDDLRYSLRCIGKAPAFSMITILLMALGIGANTAIFSLMDAVTLRLLPVKHPEELLHVALSGSRFQVLPVSFWEALRDREDMFSGLFGWAQQTFNLARGGQARNVDGLFVSGDYFTALGVAPAVGRILTANDDHRGCPGAAVLSYSFWQNQFGGDPNAVGQFITLNGYPVQVVGITAAGFFGVVAGNKFDVAVPLCAEAVAHENGNKWVRIMGRLKPELNVDEASARLAALTPSLFAALPADILGPSIRVMRLGAFPSANGLSGSGMRSTYQQPLQTMMIVVGIVLIVCSNIACLLLARATARNREIAVRLALGASRWRLVRQLLTECLVLSFAGALLGLCLARWGFEFLVGFIAAPIYASLGQGIFLDFSLHSRILGFTAGVAVLASILFAVVPSILSTRASLISAMKGSRAGEAERRSVFRSARWIVAVEVALSLLLLVVSGLFLKSFWKLATLDRGFDLKNVLLLKLDLNSAKVPESMQYALREEILARLRALPGVTSASESLTTPISGTGFSGPMDSHVPNAPTGRDAAVVFNFVSPGFFATMETPLLAGRDFTDGDTAHTQPVAILNQTAARKFFHEDNPIGKYYSSEGPLFGPQPREFLVIGVVQDAKYGFLREEFRPTAYYPNAQMMIPFAAMDRTFEIRTALRPSVIERVAAYTVASVNGAVSFQFSTLEQQVNNSIGQERLLAALSGFFGGLALLLATIGAYGVLSYTVAQRKKEIGIRMALGAGRRTIRRLVLGDAGLVLFAGCCAGLLLALGTTRLVAALLFEVDPHDSYTLALCVTLLVTTGLIAAYLPARRASRLDPMPVLRED